MDTHVWLWMHLQPEKLRASSREILLNPDNELFFSAASAWEIAIKEGRGKLTLPEPAESYVPSRLQAGGVQPLAVLQHHALRVASLPRHHDDPFDRLLIAQAQLEHLPILTADPRLRAYEVRVLLA